MFKKELLSKARITSNIRVAAHSISRRRANRVYRKASSDSARTRCTVRSEALFDVRKDDVLDRVCIPARTVEGRKRKNRERKKGQGEGSRRKSRKDGEGSKMKK